MGQVGIQSDARCRIQHRNFAQGAVQSALPRALRRPRDPRHAARAQRLAEVRGRPCAARAGGKGLGAVRARAGCAADGAAVDVTNEF